MGIRTKVLVSMMLLVVLICTAFLVLLYQQNNRSLNLLVDGKRASAKLLAESIVENTHRHYQSRVKSFLDYKVSATREQVVQAFSQRNRDELLALCLPFYQLLKKENPYFASFAWFLPDNQLFLHVDNPERASDHTNQSRQDIALINRDKVQLSGFKATENGPQLQVLQPVFFRGEYLGVLELGIDARMIIDALKEKMNLPVGISVSNKIENQTAPGSNGLTCDAHTVYSTDELLLHELIDRVDWELSEQQQIFNERPLVLHRVLSLSDYQNQHFGRLFVAIDISEVKALSRNSFMTAVLLVGLLLVLTYVLLYYSFGFLIDKILKLNHSLEQANLGLEQQVEERTQAFLTEVEERKQVEERLQRAEKMEAIGQMAGGVAHDLNNILSGVISYPELLLLRLPPDSKLRQPLGAIKESGLLAAAVVADMLTVARDAATVRRHINLNDLILEALQSADVTQVAARNPDVEIVTELDPDLPAMSGSPAHVNRCVTNLVNNAFAALNGAGLITLSTARVTLGDKSDLYPALTAGEYNALSVKDSAPAISAQDLKHIFEPFYTKKKMGRSGTGLGLAVVWNCMQDHDGSVRVESDDNNGTIFTLMFPCCREVEEAQEVASPIAAMRGQGESILVVDDEPRQRDIATQILKELGYRVTSCESGERAIELVREKSFDLLVLDMMMAPGISGSETYAQIKTINPEQRAVIVSGYSETEQKKKALSLGVEHYLFKPYTIDQLGWVVCRGLKRCP